MFGHTLNLKQNNQNSINMAKRNRKAKKETSVEIQELFQPCDFITVEQLRPGDIIQGTTFLNCVRKKVIHQVKKVVPPSRDYLYFVKRFTETNLVVFVVLVDNQVLTFSQNEKVAIIKND